MISAHRAANACERLKPLNRNAFSLFLLVASIASARPLAAPTDLWVWRSASDARIRSDGAWVVYVEDRRDQKADRVWSNLLLVSSDGRQRRALTEGNWHDRSPRWSPDGTRVAWISDRGGKQQIRIRRTDASDDAVVATGEQTPSTFAWSPDGATIAFLAPGPAREEAPKWAPPAIVPFLEPRPTAALQIFLVPASGGTVRRIDAPSLDFTGEPAWMPNGQSILCAERRGEIFSVRVADGAVRELTRTGEINRDPTPSPDGARISYTAASAPPQYYAVRKLWVMNADGSRNRQLAGTLNRDLRHPHWSNDSRTVYCIGDDRGATHVYAARNDGSVRQATNRAERLRGFSLADNGRAVTVRSSATEGSAVFTFTVDTPAGGWTLGDADQQLLAEREWGTVEELQFESAGKPMQAWLVKPPGFDAARKYPLLVEIADAPQRMYGAEFHLRAQILAAGGFVVLLANPRGTPGYGEEFGNLLETQIPAAPAEDLLRAVDAAAANGYIDAQRIAVSGGVQAVALLNRGGRFRTGIVRRLRLPFSADFHTPALIVGGAEDPVGDLLFASLRARGVDSAMVRIPAGAGGVVLELQAVLGWLKR